MWGHLPEKSRSIELYLSTVTLIFGIIFMLPGDTLALTGYGPLRSPVLNFFGSELFLGIILMWVGAGRAAAVVGNGYWYRNAAIRIAGCVLGSMLWMILILTFLTATDLRGFPGILAFLFPAFAYETFSAARCAREAFEQDSFGLRGIRKCSTTRPK